MSDDIVNIEVDGKPVEARKGQMIIEATDAVGAYIPALLLPREAQYCGQLPHVPRRGREARRSRLPACAQRRLPTA